MKIPALLKKRYEKGLCLNCGKRFKKLSEIHDCCSARCMYRAIARIQGRKP